MVPVVMMTCGVRTPHWGLRTNMVRLKTGRFVHNMFDCSLQILANPAAVSKLSLLPCQRQCGIALCRVRIYASLTPRKDAEMIIHGRSLTSHSFASALHAALRVLVDDLGCPSFNAAVGDMPQQAVDTRPLTIGKTRLMRLNSMSSDTEFV